MSLPVEILYVDPIPRIQIAANVAISEDSKVIGEQVWPNFKQALFQLVLDSST